MPDANRHNTYRHDEVQEILQIAIARQAEAGELTRSQLLEIGEELGLSELDIDVAEKEWIFLREDYQERKAFIRYRHLQFRHHAVRFAIVIGFLLLMTLLTDWTVWATAVIALLWGMFLTLDGWSAWQTEGDAFERRYQAWRRKRWLKQVRHSMSQMVSRWLNPTS